MKFNTFFYGLIRKRVIPGDPVLVAGMLVAGMLVAGMLVAGLLVAVGVGVI
jgi:hypothetical protein